MYAQPGKKLLFMGGEFGQWNEWNHDESLQWDLAQYDRHAGLQRLIEDLNRLYRSEPALHELDCDGAGFEWIDCNDAEHSVLSFLRKSRSGSEIAVVCNFTPVPRHSYRIGVPRGGLWSEILNSDSKHYWGSGQGNLGSVRAAPAGYHGRRYSLNLTLPPLATVFLKPKARK
jgi:1,4-alpha-glucan branching enzyme